MNYQALHANLTLQVIDGILESISRNHMIKWIKDNGQEIETNDRPETVTHCESIGWKKKRARRTKEQMEEDKGTD